MPPSYEEHTARARWVNISRGTDNLDNETNPAYTDGSINQEHE